MLTHLKSLFQKPKAIPKSRSPTAEEQELWKIWHSMDEGLKEFSQQVIDLGRYNAKLKLNQKGICVLVRELDKHGFAIKAKDYTGDSTTAAVK